MVVVAEPVCDVFPVVVVVPGCGQHLCTCVGGAEIQQSDGVVVLEVMVEWICCSG